MGQPVSLVVGQGASSSLAEFSGPNGTGSPVIVVGPIDYTSDNPNVASIDPATGRVLGVSAGIANVTGTDTSNGLADAVQVTVSPVAPPPPPPAQSAVLTVIPDASFKRR